MAIDDDARLTPRAREMRRLVAEQEASGLTVAEFAARRGMTAGTIFHWRHRFRGELGAAHRPTLIPVRIVDAVDDESAIAPQTSTLVVELQGGRRIAVPHDFSADDLRRLIGVVESC
jgi:hypothetical protein